MPATKEHEGDVPLYVKIPAISQEYLNEIKEQTGITKSDAVTLILEVARKFISPQELTSLYDDYMLLGTDGLRIELFEQQQ